MDTCDGTFAAAAMVHDAALTLASDAAEGTERDRYLGVAARLGAVLESSPNRLEVLDASPRVVERSGRIRTFVEMIEDEPGDDATRFRLTMVLMRALIWDPANPKSAHDAIRHNRELIRYQSLLIGKRLDEIRRRRDSRGGISNPSSSSNELERDVQAGSGRGRA